MAHVTRDFWRIANNVLNKVNLLYLLYSTARRYCFLHLIKQNCLKLHNISVTPKMVKKVIINLHFFFSSCPDCIPVVVIKKRKPELHTS